MLFSFISSSFAPLNFYGMKKYLFIVVMIAGLIACKDTDKKVAEGPILTKEEKEAAARDTSNYSKLQWIDSTNLNLGKVKKGQVVEVSYRFKNVGEKQLVISDVIAGCGCTVPEKPEKPFAPGEEGVIKAKFDSKGQHAGEHTKYVTVTANTPPNSYQLSFRVEIIE